MYAAIPGYYQSKVSAFYQFKQQSEAARSANLEQLEQQILQKRSLNKVYMQEIGLWNLIQSQKKYKKQIKQDIEKLNAQEFISKYCQAQQNSKNIQTWLVHYALKSGATAIKKAAIEKLKYPTFPCQSFRKFNNYQVLTPKDKEILQYQAGNLSELEQRLAIKSFIDDHFKKHPHLKVCYLGARFDIENVYFSTNARVFDFVDCAYNEGSHAVNSIEKFQLLMDPSGVNKINVNLISKNYRAFFQDMEKTKKRANYYDIYFDKASYVLTGWGDDQNNCTDNICSIIQSLKSGGVWITDEGYLKNILKVADFQISLKALGIDCVCFKDNRHIALIKTEKFKTNLFNSFIKFMHMFNAISFIYNQDSILKLEAINVNLEELKKTKKLPISNLKQYLIEIKEILEPFYSLSYGFSYELNQQLTPQAKQLIGNLKAFSLSGNPDISSAMTGLKLGITETLQKVLELWDKNIDLIKEITQGVIYFKENKINISTDLVECQIISMSLKDFLKKVNSSQ